MHLKEQKAIKDISIEQVNFMSLLYGTSAMKGRVGISNRLLSLNTLKSETGICAGAIER